MKRKQKVEEESVESPEIKSKTKKLKQVVETEGKKKTIIFAKLVFISGVLQRLKMKMKKWKLITVRMKSLQLLLQTLI